MASPKTTSKPTMRDRMARMRFAQIYPLYVDKVEKKGRTREDLHTVITWLTGFDDAQIAAHVDADADFEAFFEQATLNENAPLIKGVICGIRVEEIEDDLVRNVRYLDKLVDELARGKKMTSILRSA